VEVQEQFVPEYRTLSVADTKGGPTPGSEVNPGVLFQMPVFALFPYMLSGVPLGIAEGLIDDFIAGSPNRSGRMTGARIGEIQSTQIRLGEATAYARASRLVRSQTALKRKTWWFRMRRQKPYTAWKASMQSSGLCAQWTSCSRSPARAAFMNRARLRAPSAMRTP